MINWKSAILAGAAGTILFDIFGLVMTREWFPLLGAGVAGIKMDPMTPVGSLLRHWVYSLPFIYFF